MKATTPARVVTGRIKVHPDGYAFVVPEDHTEDIHVNARSRGAAMDADRVEVEWWVGGRGLEGRVRKVIERGRGKITGQIEGVGQERPPGARRPAHQRPGGPARGAHGAKAGQSVVAEIARYPEHPQDAMEVEVRKVLGDPDDPRTEVEKILACADVTEEFPAPVARAASHVPEEVRPNDRKDRVDLRHVPFITIDPETARDFDDAVAVEALPDGGSRLWVAVADVSHYVREEQPARPRGAPAGLQRLPAQPGHPHVARGAVGQHLLAGAGGGPAGDGGAHRLRPRRRSVRDTDFMAAVIHSQRPAGLRRGGRGPGGRDPRQAQAVRAVPGQPADHGRRWPASCASAASPAARWSSTCPRRSSSWTTTTPGWCATCAGRGATRASARPTR